MMKSIFVLILFSSIGFCEGPLFRQKDPAIEQEFVSVYQDLRGKDRLIPQRTKAQLSTDIPSQKNLLYICSDCSIDGLIISTDTKIGAFARATSKTTAIQ